DGCRLLFVLGLSLPEVYPSLNVVGMLLHGSLEGKRRQRQVSSLLHDPHALFEGVLLVAEDVLLCKHVLLDDGVAESSPVSQALEVGHGAGVPVVVELVEKLVFVDHGPGSSSLSLNSLPDRFEVTELIGFRLHGLV